MTKKTRYALYLVLVVARFITDDWSLKRELEGLATNLRYTNDVLATEDPETSTEVAA
jgi:hypothetical protein